MKCLKRTGSRNSVKDLQNIYFGERNNIILPKRSYDKGILKILRTDQCLKYVFSKTYRSCAENCVGYKDQGTEFLSYRK